METDLANIAANTSLQMWVNTAAIIILGLLFVYRTWRGESAKIDDSTIASLKRQIEVFQGELNVYKGQVHDLTLQIGKQNGIIETQKETIVKYERIFANRNPELDKVLTDISVFMQAIERHMKEHEAQGKKVMQELALQTSILNKGEERVKVAAKM